MPKARDTTIRVVTPRPAPSGAGVSVFKPKTRASYAAHKSASPLLGPAAPMAYVPPAPTSPQARPRTVTPRVTQASPATPALDALILGRKKAADVNSRRSELTANLEQRKQIEKIQLHLRQLGYAVTADGVMGPKTRAAMAASASGTIPNAVHHPEHAKAQAEKFVTERSARPGPTNTYQEKPFYKGQKPDGYVQTYNGRKPYYSDRLKEIPTQTRGRLDSILHPATDLIRMATGQSDFSIGGLVSDAGQVATLGVPIVAPAARALVAARVAGEAFHAEGVTANALRVIRAAQKARNIERFDRRSLKIAQKVAEAAQRTGAPIISPERDQIAAAIDQAPAISRRKGKALMRANDVGARMVADQLGTTPERAYEVMWKGAQFHDFSPTAADLRIGAYAQTGKGKGFEEAGKVPEITNLSNTPEVFQINNDALDKAARNLLRTHRAGAPPHALTPKALRAFLGELQQRAIDAADFRWFYSHSAAGIKAHVNNDVREADMLAGLVAVYSPRAEVYNKIKEWNNLDRAIGAYDEFKATGEISAKWQMNDYQTVRANEIMHGIFEWDGLKTNRFYRNFLHHIDPAKYKEMFKGEQFGTMDTWMRRLFRYPKTQKTEEKMTLFGLEQVPVGKATELVSDSMYAFMERANKAVAESLGWLDMESQSALWVSIKAELEGTPLKDAGFDFQDAIAHRAAKRARKGDQLAIGETTADPATKSSLDAAVEAANAPDGGFTLTANFNPDTGGTGYAVSYGAWEERAQPPLTREALLAYRNKHLALLKSDPAFRLGGWPEDGLFYLDISRVFESKSAAMQFAVEQGQLKTFDRAAGARGDWENAFLDTGLSAEQADAIKAGLKDQGQLQSQAATYDDMLSRAYELLTGKPVKDMPAGAAQDAENYIFDWVDKHPDAPESKMFRDLYRDSEDARGVREDPNMHFQEDPLVRGIADAHAVKVPESPIVKGAVMAAKDGSYYLHLFKTADTSTVLHELAHALERFVPEADRAALAKLGIDTPEKFARSMERFFYEGIAPTKELRKTFHTLARGMAEVYDNAGAIPGATFSPEIKSAFDSFFSREAALDPRWTARAGTARSLFQTGDTPPPVDPRLEAAAMQVDQGGKSVQEAADMLGLDPMDVQAYLDDPAHAAEQARILSLENQGASATTRSARDYLDHADKATTFGVADETGSFAAHELATQHGIDIVDVQGTGLRGRVLVADVEQHIFNNLSPRDQLRAVFGDFQRARNATGKGYSQERGKRFGKVRDIYADETMAPLDKQHAAAEALKGELPKVVVNGKTRTMSQDALVSLVAQVQAHPMLHEGQKYRVIEALRNVVESGVAPTNSEIHLMQNVWGMDTVKSLLEIQKGWAKFGQYVMAAVNVPRALMSTLDVSFGGRQGLVALFYSPRDFGKAWTDQWNYLSKHTGGGEAAYQALMKSIHESPNFPLYQRMKLAITDMEQEIGMRIGEEAYPANLAEKATIKGHGPGNVVRASGRMYTGMALKLRTELADRLLMDAAQPYRDWTRGGKLMPGRDVMNDDALLEEIGHFINAITGRGKLPTETLEKSAPLLNALLFSPRLFASRLQMLNPRNYIAGDSYVRQQYLKAGLRTFGSLTAVLGAIAYFVPGVDVGTDPRSANFGKIQLPNGTRIDLTGGFNPIFHLLGEVAYRQKKSSTTGEVSSLTSGKYGKATIAKVFGEFFINKLAPPAAAVHDLMANQDPQNFGEAFSARNEAIARFTPIIAQDVLQLYKTPVQGMNGIEAAIAGYGIAGVGIGVQTYQAADPAKKPTKKLIDQAKAAGVKPPSEKILLALGHKAELDHISSRHPNDHQGALADAIAYYVETTGKHNFDRMLGKALTSDQASRGLTLVRQSLVGPGLSEYESAVRRFGARKEKAQVVK